MGKICFVEIVVEDVPDDVTNEEFAGYILELVNANEEGVEAIVNDFGYYDGIIDEAEEEEIPGTNGVQSTMGSKKFITEGTS